MSTVLGKNAPSMALFNNNGGMRENGGFTWDPATNYLALLEKSIQQPALEVYY